MKDKYFTFYARKGKILSTDLFRSLQTPPKNNEVIILNLGIVSIILIFGAVVLYCIPKIPMWVTSMIMMVLVVWTGCIDYEAAYSGFSNKVIFLIGGMCIIGQACVETGLAYRIGFGITKIIGDSEKKAVLFLLIVGTLMAVFLNGSVVAAILIPVIDCMVVKSGGKITRKATYFPMGLASVMGNGTTAFSASSMLTCLALLVDAGYREIGAFEPLKVTGPATLLFIVFYLLVAYPLSKKVFDYPDPPFIEEGSGNVAEYDASRYPVWKQIVTGATLLIVMVALVAGGNFGAWPIIGAAVVVLTGCISAPVALRSVDWKTILTMGAALGFSTALSATGGSDILANFFIKLAGPLANSQFGMMAVICVIAGLISAPLSDNATVVATVPVVLAISTAKGWDAIPLVIACASGLKICQFMTPICCGPMTQILGGGYRGKDYMIIGGLVSLVNAVAVILMLAVVY